MNRRSVIALVLGAIAFVGLVVLPGVAHARGSVKLAKSTVEEKKGKWKLKFTIDYGGMPHIAHIPMVFSFKPTALYERYLSDETGDEPATRTVPINNGTPIDVPMDVGFADMSGKMFKVTKFTVPLTRKADFEAGEYKLTVRLAAGGKVGRPITVRLKGKNKVVNRKSISFTADSPKKKKSNDPPKQDLPTDEGPRAAEDSGLDLSDVDDISDEEAKKLLAQDNPGVDPVEPKQGGCGCEVVGDTPPAHGHRWAWLALMGLAIPIVRRRRS